MRKYPRIDIDQKAYDGLSIEAVLQHKTIREIATKAILGYISKEALMVLDHKTYEDTKQAEPPTLTKSRTRPGRPKQLAKDTAALARIIELWSNTTMPITDIAEDINRPRQTVDALIRRMIAQGKLAPRSEPGAKAGGEV